VKILVTGARGLLGTEVVADARARGHVVIALGREALDVTDAAACRCAMEAQRPDAVIHCAAYTAVDRAESEPELARALNRDATRNVADAAAAQGATMLHVSTDYVFDGRKRTPYLPSDEPAPLSVYGRTKLEGEIAAREAAPGALVVRTSWLFGGGGGFVSAMLRRAAAGERLRVVDDQCSRPTWAPDAARATLDLLESGAQGTWHVAGGGECTRLELLREALRVRGLRVEVEPISTANFGAPAPRPAYSVLDLTATEERLGRRMRDWREALRQCLLGGDAPAEGRIASSAAGREV
jgi:dTDP-4-dehydrorhamnose reductase